eukprot:13321313-Alexandrium_andersonii.AAC.1
MPTPDDASDVAGGWPAHANPTQPTRRRSGSPARQMEYAITLWTSPARYACLTRIIPRPAAAVLCRL